MNKDKIKLEGYLDLLKQAHKLLKDVGENSVHNHEDKWAEQSYEAQGVLKTAIINLESDVQKMKGGKK